MQFEFLGKRVDGVTFDLEGTVINLEPQHHRAHLEVAQEMCGLTLDLSNPQTFIDVPHLIGGPDRMVMQDLVGLAQKKNTLTTDPDIEDMLEMDSEIYHGLINSLPDENFAPRAGFKNLFEQLKTYGIPMAIGSLTETKDAFLLLAKSGLADDFRSFNFFTHKDVNHTKPDPEVYRATAGMLRISPYNQLVFEDSHNGIIAAREAGSIPVAVPVYKDRELIQRLTDAGSAAIYSEWTDITINPLIRLEGRGGMNLLEGNTPNKERR